jgi:hypothetical protein
MEKPLVTSFHIEVALEYGDGPCISAFVLAKHGSEVRE